ncbi:hypothetical protein AB0D38_35460, partial [Streptomyces sp. NPDC048279]
MTTSQPRPPDHTPAPSHATRAHSFNAAAAQYAANRPSYPAERPRRHSALLGARTRRESARATSS